MKSFGEATNEKYFGREAVFTQICCLRHTKLPHFPASQLVPILDSTAPALGVKVFSMVHRACWIQLPLSYSYTEINLSAFLFLCGGTFLLTLLFSGILQGPRQPGVAMLQDIRFHALLAPEAGEAAQTPG